MKLTTRHDIETPIARVFDALCDADRWERDALRRGVELERTGPAGRILPGTGWHCRFTSRGRARDLTLRVVRVDAPGRIEIDGVSNGYVLEVEVELIAMARGRTRIITRTDLRATSLGTRLLLQSARLAKAQLEARLQGRVDLLFAAIEARG